LTRRALPSVSLQNISGGDESWQSVDHTLVDADQNVPIGAKSDGSDVFAVLERKGKGFVTMKRMRKLNAAQAYRTVTDLTKSKTDTLLPTGLSTELPSGVNMMFPC
jgi:hypothetical protein